MPPLRLTEVGRRCRLWIRGCAHGDGATLQEAADDLVRRVLGLLRSCARVRSAAGVDRPAAAGPPSRRACMHEVAQIAAGGGDIRERLFGVSPA